MNSIQSLKIGWYAHSFIIRHLFKASQRSATAGRQPLQNVLYSSYLIHQANISNELSIDPFILITLVVL